MDKPKQKNQIFKKIVTIISIFIIVLPSMVFSANLGFSPSSGSYDQNTSFSVAIYVSSQNQAINAVSVTVKFPTDILSITSISKSGSIIDFWAQEPSFSNTSGEIKVEGVVLTPGFKGSSGKILTINFRGKKVGTSNITISSPSVLANDGLGTNVFQSATNAVFTIKEVVVKDPEIIKIEELKPIISEAMGTKEVCTPDAIISSSTHPGIIWRRENTAIFSWNLKEDTLASKIAFDRNPNTEPTIINNPAIVEKRYENLEDGIWYFHLSLQNNDGWEKTEHFKIKIDHTPPEINAKEITRSDLTDPKPIINLQITDKTSCVKSFEFSINGQKIDYEKLPNGDYRLSSINPGEHELVITAYDMAGNKNEKLLPIKVEALPTPKITDYPKEMSMNDTLVVVGETIPNGNIEAKITSKRNNFLINQEFQSGSGKFTLYQDNLKRGIIFVSFRVSDSRGAKSSWSTPIEIKVKGSSQIESIFGLVDSLGMEIFAGILILIFFLAIIITRSLTIRKIKRELNL